MYLYISEECLVALMSVWDHCMVHLQWSNIYNSPIVLNKCVVGILIACNIRITRYKII